MATLASTTTTGFTAAPPLVQHEWRPLIPAAPNHVTLTGRQRILCGVSDAIRVQQPVHQPGDYSAPIGADKRSIEQFFHVIWNTVIDRCHSNASSLDIINLHQATRRVT